MSPHALEHLALYPNYTPHPGERAWRDEWSKLRSIPCQALPLLGTPFMGTTDSPF